MSDVSVKIRLIRLFNSIGIAIYNLKWGIKNLYTHFSIIWRTRPWSFDGDVLEIMLFKLKQIEATITKYESDWESSENKLKDIRRCITLLEHVIADNYIERLGGLTNINGFNDTRTEKEKELDTKIILAANDLSNDEWKLLWDTIAHGGYHHQDARSWWH